MRQIMVIADPPIGTRSQELLDFLVARMHEECAERRFVSEHRELDQCDVLPLVEILLDRKIQYPGWRTTRFCGKRLIAIENLFLLSVARIRPE